MYLTERHVIKVGTVEFKEYDAIGKFDYDPIEVCSTPLRVTIK